MYNVVMCIYFKVRMFLLGHEQLGADNATDAMSMSLHARSNTLSSALLLWVLATLLTI